MSYDLNFLIDINKLWKATKSHPSQLSIGVFDKCDNKLRTYLTKNDCPKLEILGELELM